MGMSHSAPIYHWIASGIALLLFKLALDKALSLRTAFSRVKDAPGRMPLWIHAVEGIAIALGTIFPRQGMVGHVAAKFSFYEKLGATSFATIRMWASQPYFWLADQEALKQVTMDRFTFEKDVVTYKGLNVYGTNVISTDGHDWKRHRAAVMSAFNETNVALVWSAALRVVNEWLEELDATSSDITLDLDEPIKQVTLLTIASGAFGKHISWSAKSEAELPPGCKLSFQSAVIISVENIMFKALLPNWFYKLLSVIKVPYLSDRALLTQLAFDDLRIHMADLVASARADISSGKRAGISDASSLRNIVEEHMNQENDSKKLAEDEILSNIFAFLLAGHETSAHSLCFTFALLALHPHCQQEIYEEITHLWPSDVPISQLMTNHREYMDKLVSVPHPLPLVFLARHILMTNKEYTIACIRETLRLFPAVPRIGKNVYKDTVLPGTSFTPGSKDYPSMETGKFSMAVPAGSFVVLDIWALHSNTLYWGQDADEFRPEHFIDTPSYQWPRNAFLPFSGGARSCIGPRFALAEMVGTLASVVRKYTIHVPDDLVDKAELLRWKSGITLTPTNPRVKLCRRV